MPRQQETRHGFLRDYARPQGSCDYTKNKRTSAHVLISLKYPRVQYNIMKAVYFTVNKNLSNTSDMYIYSFVWYYYVHPYRMILFRFQCFNHRY